MDKVLYIIRWGLNFIKMNPHRHKKDSATR